MSGSKANGNGTQLTEQERYKIRNLLKTMEPNEHPPLDPRSTRKLALLEIFQELHGQVFATGLLIQFANSLFTFKHNKGNQHFFQ